MNRDFQPLEWILRMKRDINKLQTQKQTAGTEYAIKLREIELAIEQKKREIHELKVTMDLVTSYHQNGPHGGTMVLRVAPRVSFRPTDTKAVIADELMVYDLTQDVPAGATNIQTVWNIFGAAKDLAAQSLD